MLASVAILVSVAVPVFANQRAKADTAVAQAEGNAIAKTLQAVLSGRAGTNFSNGLGPQISISMRDGAGVIHYGRGPPYLGSLSRLVSLRGRYSRAALSRDPANKRIFVFACNMARGNQQFIPKRDFSHLVRVATAAPLIQPVHIHPHYRMIVRRIR